MRDSLSSIRLSPRSSVPKQLSHQLREMIVSGKMSEGSRLPSNQELAQQWQVAASSVQAAMSKLVKEGLLQRARKRGTFVAKRSRALTHAAIYLADDIWQMRAAAFRRALVASLSQQLRDRKIQPDIWSDSRLHSNQSESWSDFVRAAERRQFQAVLMCSGSPDDHAWLARLPLPFVSLSHRLDCNCVGVDTAHGERLAAEELARKGCRSMGMISPVMPAKSSRALTPDTRPKPGVEFLQAARDLGLEVREDWMKLPTGKGVEEPDAEKFGYEQMKQMLTASKRPDGIFVTHDWVASGALVAVLENRIAVPQKLKLVLHRNVEIGMLCPVEASFLDFQISDVAAGMISVMDAQLRGDEVEAVRIRPRIATK